MNDLIPIVFFVGCLLATFGLVRLCEWLRPISATQRADASVASRSTNRPEEVAR